MAGQKCPRCGAILKYSWLCYTCKPPKDKIIR